MINVWTILIARKQRVLSAVACLAIAFGGSTRTLGVERYVVTSWGHRDGLPSTLIYAITQTRDGYLWLGTSDGLVRFDGINFDHQKLTVNSEPMLGAVTALHGANDGALWIGAGSGLITRMIGTQLRTFRLGAEIQTIIEMPTGDMWAVANTGLYRFANAEPGKLAPVETLAATEATKLIETGSRGLMLGKRGFALEAAEDLKQFAPARGRQVELDGRPFSITQGLNGSVWFAKSTARREDTYSVFLHDRRGCLWAGSSLAGLIRRVPEGSSATPELASRLVESLFEDREGNVWVGANNGLYQFRYGKVFSLSTHDGLTNDRVSSVGVDGETVWVGTQTGLDRIDKSDIREYLGGVNVLTVKPVRNHDVWVGTKNGVFTLTGSSGVLQSKVAIRELSSVTAIEEDRAGCIWLLDAEKGLYQWHDRVLISIGGAAKFVTGGISSIRAQSDGTVWIGFSGGGTTVFRNSAFHESPALSEIATGTVYDSYVESPDVVWLASEKGLYRLKGKASTVWNTKNGLPGNRVLWLQPDGSDWLWLGFSTGIARVRRSVLTQSETAASQNVSCDFFDFEDGLLANPVRQSQASAGEDSDGKLWVTTSAGVAMVDSRHLEKNNVPPNVVIERVIADNREVAAASSIHFPPLTKNLEIDYAALSLAVPRKVRFRYQLDGYDKQWQDAGSRRQAFYTNLQPGGYRFQVLAANNDGVWNKKGVSIDFIIQPAFQQTQTFKVLCFAALGLIAFGVYRLRIQRVQAALNARFEERLAERTRIAQELHDELLQNAMGVSLQIELVDSLVDEPPQAKAHLQRALTLSRALMQTGRAVLRDLRDKTRDAADIAKILTASMEAARQEGGPEATLTVEGTPRAVSPPVADDLAQIGCQAIVNAFQHAGARNIEVHLNYKTTELRLQVNDDGCGINPRIAESGKPGHYGVIGMRERAERIGGTLIIASVAGQGTRLTASVPGKHAYRNPKRND